MTTTKRNVMTLLALPLFFADCVVCFPNPRVQSYAEGAAKKSTPKNTIPSNKKNLKETHSFFPPPISTTNKIATEEQSSQALVFTEDDSSKLTPAQRKTVFILCLIVLTGVTEAICFRRFQSFPNMMTGNTVRCFDALADLRFGTFFRHAGMITSYVTGVSLFVTLKHLQQKCLHLQKTPTLVWVARVAAMLFGISDVTGSLTVGAGSDGGAGRHAFRLIPMALGFGMINAAVTEATGTVTNAVTGHWTKVGFGTAERLLVPDQTTKGFSTSIKAIGTFILSLLSTNLIYQWVETKPLILSKLPPLGVGLGSLYFALLSWYSRAETSS